MNFVTSLVLFGLIAAFAIRKSDSAKVTVDDVAVYTTNDGLTILFLKQTTNKKGQCIQYIRIVYEKGPVEENVPIKCPETTVERMDDKSYVIGNVLYSPNGRSVFVVTPENKLVWYQKIKSELLGPQPEKTPRGKRILEVLNKDSKEGKCGALKSLTTCDCLDDQLDFLDI